MVRALSRERRARREGWEAKRGDSGRGQEVWEDGRAVPRRERGRRVGGDPAAGWGGGVAGAGF